MTPPRWTQRVDSEPRPSRRAGSVGAKAIASRDIALLVLLGVVATALFHRQVLFGGFKVLPGDGGDTQFVIRILEHWFEVFTGHASWRSPRFFYPVEGALGYSDALFLYSLPFTLLRATGMDVFSAYQGLLIFLTAAGFVGAFLVARLVFGFTVATSLLGAFLFANLNAFRNASGHGQLLAVYLIPWLVMIAYRYLSAPLGSRRKLWGAAGAVLLALFFFTSYYAAWFLTFFAPLSSVALLCVLALRRGWPATVNAVVRMGRWKRHSAVLVVFAVALAPFFLTYVPVIQELGSPTRFSPRFVFKLPDLFNVGPKNFVWGSLLSRLDDLLPSWTTLHHEVDYGIPPIMLSIFLVTLCLETRDFLRRKGHRVIASSRDVSAGAVVILGATVLISVLTILDVEGFSLWRLFVKFVPGASAVAAPSRFLLVLSLPVLYVTLFGLERMWRAQSSRHFSTAAGRYVFRAVVLLICAGLLFEQFNSRRWTFDKTNKLALHEAFAPRPSGCEVAYITSTPVLNRPYYEYSNDAMLITAHLGIPAINGYSGLYPPNWTLVPDSPDYEHAMYTWILTHGLVDQACGLDLNAARWITDTKHKIYSEFEYVPGTDISFFRQANTSRRYLISGWFPAEDGGTWTKGTKANLAFRTTRFRPGHPVQFQALLAPVAAGRHLLGTAVAVNGTVVWRGILTKRQNLTIFIPGELVKADDFFEINFLIDNPVIPRELGINLDPRELGLRFESLRLSQ